MSADFNWICPHCNRSQTVTTERRASTSSLIFVGNIAEGQTAVTGHFIGCANPECGRLTASLAVRPTKRNQAQQTVPDYSNERAFFSRRVMPEGSAKPQPEYIPKAIRDDYFEACLILQLSPKAAATLIRRCLQGMIRDFAGISDRTLYKEIDQLRDAVSAGKAPQGVTDETVDAIDHVRKVGNIGAHMEADINHIVEVDAGEAEALVELTEMLFEEWYVARNRRQARLAKIAAIASAKEEARKAT